MPAKLIAAAPVADEHMRTLLQEMLDEVVILETPLFYRSVSQGYENFNNLSDEEALLFIETWENEHTAAAIFSNKEPK